MITNIASLRTWFLEGSKSLERPFFVLNQNGAGKTMIARNDTITDLDQAWALLETNILAQAEGGVANVRVFITDKPKHNYGLETEARIMPLYAAQTSVQPGIGALPPGYVEESKIKGILDAEREKWDLERRLDDLEAQLAAPKNWTESLMEGIERIGATPLGQVIIAKLVGVTPTAQMAASPINGTPSTSGASKLDNEEDYDDNFYQNIEDTAAILGVDEKTLASKIATLVKQNPEFAKTLII